MTENTALKGKTQRSYSKPGVTTLSNWSRPFKRLKKFSKQHMPTADITDLNHNVADS